MPRKIRDLCISSASHSTLVEVLPVPADCSAGDEFCEERFSAQPARESRCWCCTVSNKSSLISASWCHKENSTHTHSRQSLSLSFARSLACDVCMDGGVNATLVISCVLHHAGGLPRAHLIRENVPEQARACIRWPPGRPNPCAIQKTWCLAQFFVSARVCKQSEFERHLAVDGKKIFTKILGFL